MSDEDTETRTATEGGDPDKDAPAPGEAASVEEASTSRWSSLSVRWIAIGAIIIGAGINFADKIVVAYVERNSGSENGAAGSDLAVIKAAIDRGSADELTTAQKAELQSAVAGQWPILAAYAAALLFVPLVMGVLIGRRSSSATSAAIAVCVGASAGFVMLQVSPLSAAAGAVIYLGLGALAGLLGRRLARRRAAA